MASGLQARRGFEGAYFASGGPTRRRGRAGARDGGGGGDWMIRVILQTVSQQQGPGMNILLLNTMHVSKYKSAKDLAKSIFCIAYLHIQLNLDP